MRSTTPTESLENVSSSATDGAYEAEHSFTGLDFLFNIISIILYLVDVGSDIFLAWFYFCNGEWWWFRLTISFILLSSLTTTLCSFEWLYICFRRISTKERIFRVVCIILQISPVLSYIDTIRFGLKGRRALKHKSELARHWLKLMVLERSQSASLRLMECVIEAAPQLVLQVYILCVNRNTIDEGFWRLVLQMITISTSLCSLSWGMAASQKSRRAVYSNKASMNYYGFAAQFFWHLFTIASRILALAIFASHFGWIVFVVIGAHWMLIICWILMMRTKYFDTRCEELQMLFYAGGIALVYVFTYFNLYEGQSHTRLRYLFFYAIVYTENVALVLVWRLQTDDTRFALPIVLVVTVGFFVGIAFRILYYMSCHPNNSLPDSKEKAIKWWRPWRELSCIAFEGNKANMQELITAKRLIMIKAQLLEMAEAQLLETTDALQLLEMIEAQPWEMTIKQMLKMTPAHWLKITPAQLLEILEAQLLEMTEAQLLANDGSTAAGNDGSTAAGNDGSTAAGMTEAQLLEMTETPPRKHKGDTIDGVTEQLLTKYEPL